MLPPSLIAPFIRPIERLGVRYMVTGSTAGILYGEPRMTHDVDIVVALPLADVDAFCAVFPLEEFYCPPADVLAIEVRRGMRGHCNLIHHETGFKADIYLAFDALHRWGLERARTLELEDLSLRVAPVEYVIVRKLEYYREGGSGKHLRDIRSILEVGAEMDRQFLDAEIAARGLSTAWAAVTAPP